MAPCADPILWPSVSVASVSRLAVITCWTHLRSWTSVGCVGAKATHAGRCLAPSVPPGGSPRSPVPSCRSGPGFRDSGGPCIPGSASCSVCMNSVSCLRAVVRGEEVGEHVVQSDWQRGHRRPRAWGCIISESVGSRCALSNWDPCQKQLLQACCGPPLLTAGLSPNLSLRGGLARPAAQGQ